MNRRDFIAATCAAPLVPQLLGAAATDRRVADSSAHVPAIDTHTHFYDPTRPEGVPWPNQSDTVLYAPHLPDAFRTVVASLRVVGTVVVEASPWVEDNQWLLDLAKKHPSIVGVVGNLRPGDPSFADQLRRFAANPLFRGLRLGLPALARVGTTEVDADLKRLADAALSLDVLGRLPILEPTLRVARRWPTLRIVIDHLPFADWDGNVPAMRSALASLAAQRNVYIKLSEIVRRVDGRIVEDPAFYAPALDALVELFGPDRILYGSNWPVSERIAPYATVHRIAAAYFAARGRRVAENYFWRNSLEAYRWSARGEAAALLRA